MSHSASATCSGGSFYTFYPNAGGVNTYAYLQNTSTNTWNTDGWDDFNYSMYPGTGILVAGSGSTNIYYVGTSGFLYTAWEYDPITGGPAATFTRTSTYNFRMLMNNTLIGTRNQRAAYHDMNVETDFRITALQTQPSGQTPFRGVHLFARYVNEDQYYVASVRSNGDVLVKKQSPNAALGCPYDPIGTVVRLKKADGTRLPAGTSVTLNRWYAFRFMVVGTVMNVWVDGVQQFNSDLSDATFDRGTAGVRTDYVNVDLDNVKFY